MDSKKRTLGKGLDALFKVNNKEPYLLQNDDQIQNLNVSQLVAGKYQPRSIFGNNPMQELIASIKSEGIIQPLIVRKKNENQYEIIAGERRWRAAQTVGLEKVPVVIKDIPDEKALAYSLIENIQREDLNPIEEATAIKRLLDEFQMTHDQVATSVGKSRPTISNLLRLLTLDEEIQILLMNKHIEVGHAKLLVVLDSEKQIQIGKIISERNLSVRETEKLIDKVKSNSQILNSKVHLGIGDIQQKIEGWSMDFSKLFSSKVDIKLNQKGEGRVVIKVNSPEEIEWLLNHIKMEK
jgi:ParB family chromosome partitioning protein